MAILNQLDIQISDEYNKAKNEVNSYKIANLSSRAAKGSVASAKANYSQKEQNWFNNFVSRNSVNE